MIMPDSKRSTMKIYLTDLVYDTIRTNRVVPLNIGYIAALLDRKFGKEVSIKLFKNPTKLESAIKSNPPDILGLSHYSWNSRLNQFFVKLAKKRNPETLTVMGGPNIRTDASGLKDFLMQCPDLDSYILFEGEKPFAELVEKRLEGDKSYPVGCASLEDNELIYQPVQNFSKQPKEIDFPSPYLTGFLDEFLSDPELTPMLETNRGCPYGCIYCAWGVATLSKVRVRSMDTITKEIDYIAKQSAGQVQWIVCDANFGFLPRDLEITKKMRSTMDANGYPNTIGTWASKNTTQRNIEIAKILNPQGNGYIAIQSADEDVLLRSGRGKIKSDRLVEQIKFFKDQSQDVTTDILIGLPGESAQSHLNTLIKAFDLGFGEIHPVNIRLLPGTDYESEAFRNKYQVQTKFRPIFGSYGVFGGQLVFELDESVRATKDMSELELNNFKVLHWLIFFTWNLGMFKPLLRFGQLHGLNIGKVLHSVAGTSNETLRVVFDELQQESIDEWFDSAEEMIAFYEDRNNFDEMVANFTKLNFKYISHMYRDPNIIKTLETEILDVIRTALKVSEHKDLSILDDICRLSSLVICIDPLQEEFKKRMYVPRSAVQYFLTCPNTRADDILNIEISRPRDSVNFCHYYLARNGGKDLSLKNLCRFFEVIGCFSKLKNIVEIVN
jgi:radical SAM superfamily enzyme YgiQ (UPF0313 family)